MKPPRYQLNIDQVLATVRRLRDRIGDRFPDSGLRGQAEELVRICERAKGRTTWITTPIWPIRILTVAFVLALVSAIVMVFIRLPIQADKWTFEQAVQTMESGINDLVLTGLGVFFLVSIETRIKRKRVLNSLHELRSMAHVIDMHQLTKDPDRLLSNRRDTSHSPKSKMTAFELRRYLDYCSEMLSLCGKIAAIYIQNFEDAHAVAAVNEIEDLTTGLSRKIWQKIMILQSMSDNQLAPSQTQPPPTQQPPSQDNQNPA